MPLPTKLGDFIRLSVRCRKELIIQISAVVNGHARGQKYFTLPAFTVSTIDASEVAGNYPGLVDGELVALNVNTSTDNIQAGDVWVVAGISNQNHPTVMTNILFAGYLTSGTQLGYPGSPINDPLSGNGILKCELLTDIPGAGDLYKHRFTVPTDLAISIEAVWISNEILPECEVDPYFYMIIRFGYTVLFEHKITSGFVFESISSISLFKGAIHSHYQTETETYLTLPFPGFTVYGGSVIEFQQTPVEPSYVGQNEIVYREWICPGSAFPT